MKKKKVKLFAFCACLKPKVALFDQNGKEA